jgi:hypothetical protein
MIGRGERERWRTRDLVAFGLGWRHRRGWARILERHLSWASMGYLVSLEMHRL